MHLSAQTTKIKKIYSEKKFLIFREMELSNSKIKTFFIFSQKKSFSYIFSKNSPARSSLSPQKATLKKFLIFSQKSPQFFWNGNHEKILMFQETELSYILGSNFPRSHFFYTFSFKEVKIFKLKYFLIIIIRHFFSFYIIVFYTQQAFVLLHLRDFCNVQNHVDIF